jgi:hypothetical protein
MQSIICWPIIICLLIAFTSFIAFGARIYSSLVREINADRPVDRRIKEGDRTKTFYVVRRHSQLFPTSPRRRLLLSFGFLGILSFCGFCMLLLKCYGQVVSL